MNKVAILIAALVIGCAGKSKDSGAVPPVEAGTVKESKTVLSFLGMRHPTFETEKMMAATSGYRFGVKLFFGEVFKAGADAPALDKLIEAKRLNKLVAALTFPRTGGGVKAWPGDFAPNNVRAQLAAVLPYLNKAKAQGAKIYVTLVTEDNQGNCAKKTEGFKAARAYLNGNGHGDARIIDNPCGCSPAGCATASGAELFERHGSNPPACSGKNLSVDPDGSPMGSPESWISRYKNCEVMAVWRESYNGKPGPTSPRDRNFAGKIDWAEVKKMLELGVQGVSIPVEPVKPPAAGCTAKDTFVDGAKVKNLYKPEADNRKDECVVIFKNEYLSKLVSVEFHQNGKRILKQDWDIKNSASPWSTHQGLYDGHGTQIPRPYVSVKRPKGSIQVRAIGRDGSVTCFDDVKDASKRYD